MDVQEAGYQLPDIVGHGQ